MQIVKNTTILYEPYYIHGIQKKTIFGKNTDGIWYNLSIFIYICRMNNH